MKLSIIICTHNRVAILKLCLNAIRDLSFSRGSLEVLVIDNNSTDSTRSLVEECYLLDDRIKYYKEEKVGLIAARNRGAAAASGKWLIYLDDDALLDENSFREITQTIDTHPFLLFTGIWKEWHLQTPPKWLPYNTGNYILRGTDEIRAIGDDYITGLIMIVRRDKLLEIGGFPPHLVGMSGDKIAYGDESWVEHEFRKRGWSVGINPNIVIEHLVGEHKYKLSWHLEAAFAKGRDTQIIHRSFSKISAMRGLVKNLLLGWLKPMAKFILRSKYYWQNFVIDYIGGIRYYKGVLEYFKNKN